MSQEFRGHDSGLPRWLGGKRIHLPKQEMQDTQVPSLGQEDPLEEEMAIHASILPWKIPWTEEPGGLLFMGSQRVRHNLACAKMHNWDNLIVNRKWGWSKETKVT